MYQTREEIIEKLQQIIPNLIQKFVVGLETIENQNGKKVHCYLELNQKTLITNMDYFNIFGQLGVFWELSGQVKSYIRKIKAIDNQIIFSFNLVQELEEKRISQNQQMNSLEAIGFKKSLQNRIISMEEVENSILYLRINNYDQELQSRQLRQSHPQQIQMTLRSKILDLRLNWGKKRRHIYLYAQKPNYGKTYFLSELERNFRCSSYQNKLVEQDSIYPDTEFLLFDDFPIIPFDNLVKIWDGQQWYKQRFTPAIQVKDAIIIMTSCDHPDHIDGQNATGNKSQKDRRAEFQKRFIFVDLEELDQPFESESESEGAIQLLLNTQHSIDGYDVQRNPNQNRFQFLPVQELPEFMSGLSIQAFISLSRSQEESSQSNQEELYQ